MFLISLFLQSLFEGGMSRCDTIELHHIALQILIFLNSQSQSIFFYGLQNKHTKGKNYLELIQSQNI